KENQQEEHAVDHRRHVQFQAAGMFAAAAGEFHEFGSRMANLTLVIFSLSRAFTKSLATRDFARRSTRSTTLTRSGFPPLSAIVSCTAVIASGRLWTTCVMM